MDIATMWGSTRYPTLQSAVLAVVLILSTVACGLAAEIVSVKGEVLVNTGTGYQPVGDRMTVSEGDAAIASPGSQASLVYADGCVINVVPGVIAFVKPKSPCSEGAANTDALPPLTPTKSFKRDWLVGGAAQLKRTAIPAGP
jgi:hypothetical protein